MQRRSSDAFWKIEADADLGAGSDGKGDRVTENWRARGNRDRMTAPESDRLNRAWSDARGVDRHRDSHGADEEGCGAVLVGKANADLGASDGGPHTLSHGLIFHIEQRLLGIGRRWLWAGRPSGNPSISRSPSQLGNQQKEANENTIPHFSHVVALSTRCTWHCEDRIL